MAGVCSLGSSLESESRRIKTMATGSSWLKKLIPFYSWGILIPDIRFLHPKYPNLGTGWNISIIWGYPPPTNSEIIICSFLWRAPYKPSLFTVVSGPGIPPNETFLSFPTRKACTAFRFMESVSGGQYCVLAMLGPCSFPQGFSKWEVGRKNQKFSKLICSFFCWKGW